MATLRCKLRKAVVALSLDQRRRAKNEKNCTNTGVSRSSSSLVLESKLRRSLRMHQLCNTWITYTLRLNSKFRSGVFPGRCGFADSRDSQPISTFLILCYDSKVCLKHTMGQTGFAPTDTIPDSVRDYGHLKRNESRLSFCLSV